MARKAISASLRWTVFARDGFTCRYCGAQAGQEGVELAADHVVSVADGGDNAITNLVTACQKCNGGKGARSLKDAPTAADVILRIQEQARNLEDQAEAISSVVRAKKAADQSAVNLKCGAYGVHTVTMLKGEKARISALCKEYGADKVMEWYMLAAKRQIEQAEAIKYVYGIIRKIRKDSGVDDAR